MRNLAVGRLICLAVAILFLGGLTPGMALPSPSQPVSAQSAWEVVTPPSKISMYALDMLGANDGWSGGAAGFIYHYTGGQWQGVTTTFQKAVQGIDMVGSGSGWGVTATGEVLRCTSSTWAIHSKPSEGLSDIYMMSASDGFAVGAMQILRYQAASDTWLEVYSTPRWLKGIDMINTTDGWVVGQHAAFVHWNGSTWTGGSTAEGIFLNDVDMVSSNDAWAVGSNGVIYHYNGAWAQVPSPTTNDLNAVSMLTASDGWAVGESGTLLHYDGSSWQSMASPTTSDLHAVQILSATNGWAMGSIGTLLHFVGLPPDLSASSKTVDAQHAVVGQELQYTITVNNSGQRPAPSVVVTDATPAGATYVTGSASTTQGAISSTDPLVVQLGDVAAGGQATISFKVTVDDLGSACWSIVNQAVIDMGGAQFTRLAGTFIGDCPKIFLPVVMKNL